MTKEELKSLPHLSKVIEKPNMLNIVTEENYYMTDWKEEDDIKLYSAATIFYFPIMEKYNEYRIVDKAYHDKKVEEMREAFEKEKEL